MRHTTFLLTFTIGLGVHVAISTAQQPGGRSTNTVVERMMAFDKNTDGKLTKDEITDARLLRLFNRSDANEDGDVTRDELTAVATQLEAEGGQGGARRGPGGPGGGPPPGEGDPNDRGPGGERGPGGPGGPPPGGERGGPGGPRSPEEFVNLAMQFDADQDGKLNKEELMQLAGQLGRRGPGGQRGPGGPGGPPPSEPGGPPPGGPREPQGANGRPQRPQ